MNLLFRIYDPKEGTITIDNQDLRDLKFNFRENLTMVPQNGNLFNDTVLFNLQYGNPEATEEEIIDVCKKCQIHESILKMEKGYDTLVGEMGNKLSGGEKQRVLIARGLLK